MKFAIELAERRLLPDSAVRFGIRRLLRRRLESEQAGDWDQIRRSLEEFVAEMSRSPIALATDLANEQHYELPAEFFRIVLGPQLKYSSCLWPSGTRDLAEAEKAMLELTCERAGIEDGMEVLELGCGWGSLSLWIASHYPKCSVLAVSNSHSQAEFIRERCASEGITNLEVMTCDMNDFRTDRRFDRIVSIEMFEHMRNWRLLFARISSWLRPDGAFLMHVFCHRSLVYPYVAADSSDWMARHFFTGGMMPSDDLPYHLDSDLEVNQHWRINGVHYSRTLEAWLETMDSARDRLMPIFVAVYGKDARRWFARWRIFFMACSELFRFRRGREWWVSHYLFRPTPASRKRMLRSRAA
jgi:cyclopropane-fatty-acyl-phospholipid synthase